ncbi:hypothetical protein F5879DRAFT_995980 [Lentinula edodes]|nr:hypothetical protein F5879DRAFT_995980 [Lentinula edodes]
MGDISWLENPLGPYYLGDSFEIDDTDGVSLGSPSSTGEPLCDEALSSELIPNDQVDIGVSDAQPPPTVPSQHSLGPASTREQQLRSFISLRPKSSSQPAIICLNNANGVIHFQNAGLSSHPPLLSPSSSRAFSSQSRDGFAAAGGLVVSKPAAKGAPSLKLPSKPLERPAGQDGCFTSAQKGKKRVPATVQRESSFPDLLYPPDFKLDKHPPKEKAGDRDLWMEWNFIHLHQLLTLDQSTLTQLLTALNKLQSDFTMFLNDFNHNLQPSLTLLPSPSASPPSLSTLTPEPLGSTSDFMALTGTCPDLLSRITDGPSLPVPAIHKCAHSEHKPTVRSPSKVPRISSQHHSGHSPSAILLALARWALPASSAAIIAMIGRCQPFFAARGASLPLPDLAERLDANEDGSYVKRVSFVRSAHPSPYPSSSPPTSHTLNPVPLHTPNDDPCTARTTPPLTTQHPHLKIMSWNINGRYLLNFLSSEFLNLFKSADVILLQETRLQSETCMKTPPGFISFVRNRRHLDNDLENPWGGVATLVRNNLHCRLHQDLSSPDLLVVDVNGTLIRNVYIPPESSRTN